MQDQGGGQEMLGAVESTIPFGVNGACQNGLSSSARICWLDEALLVEDNSVRSDASLLMNAGLTYRRGAAQWGQEDVDPLDSKDSDIAYFYGSRLPGERAEGTDDVHFHGIEPRSAQANFTRRWYGSPPLSQSSELPAIPDQLS